jgi:transposase
VRLLVDHREDLVAERTRIINRLRWHLHELGLGAEPTPGSLNRRATLDALAGRLVGDERPVARLARALIDRLGPLNVEIDSLGHEIGGLVADIAPRLLELVGCGPLTAAKLVGEVAGIERFHSRAAFAMHNGTAPIPVWSGNTERFRLNRGGNRQLNAAIHRIAITQLRVLGRAQEYVARHRAAGKTKTEALRSLRRCLSDEVYRRMQVDARSIAQPSAALRRAA